MTLTVHEPEAGIVPPESASEFEPAAPVADPPQVVTRFGVPEFTRTPG